MFAEIQLFQCVLCACAANDAGREATGGSPHELAAKRLVLLYTHAGFYTGFIAGGGGGD